MTSTWFFPAFLVFAFFGIYVWFIGGAAFGSPPGIAGLFRLPWLGYGLLLGLLQIAHLSWPIDRSFSAWFLILTSALAGVVHLGRATLRGRFPKELVRRWSALLPLAAIAFLAFLPVFNTCSKPACHYDLGLYYLQEIRWMETFPIVRGLGNLILNLGFNQSAFLATSIVDALLPDRVGLWLVGGLLPWLGLTLSIYALLRVLTAGKKTIRSPLEIAYALSAPAWIYTLLGNNISSGSPDVTTSCLIVHLFLVFAAFTMTGERDERSRLFGDVIVLGALSICLKLNTLGMVLGILVVAILFLVLEKDLSGIWRSKAVLGATVAACLLGFWFYRGILLSGYPLFPSRMIGAPVAWQLKSSEADQCRADTVYWARIPWGDRDVALGSLNWVGPWIKRVASLDIQFDWPIGIGLAGSSTLLLLAWMEEPLRRGVYYLMLLSSPLLLDTIFWIFTAPEPRYFGPTAWLFAATPILGFVAVERSFAFLSVLANLYLCAVPMAGLLLDTRWEWTAPDSKFPEIPRSNMAEYTNRLGLNYYAPVEGNQSFDNALPCSNKSMYNVELLDPAAGISGGFRPVAERETTRLGGTE